MQMQHHQQQRTTSELSRISFSNLHLENLMHNTTTTEQEYENENENEQRLYSDHESISIVSSPGAAMNQYNQRIFVLEQQLKEQTHRNEQEVKY
jgi:hypothetical protein